MIIDTDVDIDDWLAILYLLNHPEIDVKAISVVGTGACHLQPGTRNALDLLQLAGHPDIPVAMGADRPLDYGHPLRHGGARQGPRVPAQRRLRLLGPAGGGAAHQPRHRHALGSAGSCDRRRRRRLWTDDRRRAQPPTPCLPRRRRSRLLRPEWDTYAQVQDAFDTWRPIYNHHRPHDALDSETTVPADRYQPSSRSLPTQIDPPDYPDGTHVRKASPQGRFSWRGRLWRAGKPFAGRLIGIRPTTTDGTYTVYYRHQLIRTITLP